MTPYDHSKIYATLYEIDADTLVIEIIKIFRSKTPSLECFSSELELILVGRGYRTANPVS